MAFLSWMVITVKQKPIMQRTFTDLTVNINLENTFVAENGMNIIGDISEQKFTVVVTGPTSAVSGLSAADLGIYASAGDITVNGCVFNDNVAEEGSEIYLYGGQSSGPGVWAVFYPETMTKK